MWLRFEWDPHKAASNAGKHGVSFDEAQTAFADPLGLIVADPRHSVDEEREVLIALTEKGRLVAVMFTERDSTIRIISARTATRRERLDYEEGQD
jgi:uncharacterized DUF497 family protein